jgi:hypothetical protein
MIEAGEDPRFIARRLIVHASEDVGMADPTALQTAVAAAQAVEFVGLPEARLNLAQAVIHIALAPKSNAVAKAILEAGADVQQGMAGPVPKHLRDASYPGAARLGHGKGYLYAHDEPAGVVQQQYAPDGLVGKRYYLPSGHGAEARYADRSERIRQILRGGAETAGGSAQESGRERPETPAGSGTEPARGSGPERAEEPAAGSGRGSGRERPETPVGSGTEPARGSGPERAEEPAAVSVRGSGRERAEEPADESVRGSGRQRAATGEEPG